MYGKNLLDKRGYFNEGISQANIERLTNLTSDINNGEFLFFTEANQEVLKLLY